MKKRILLFTISLLSACNNQQQQPVEQLQETIRVHNIPINVITPQNGVPIDFEKKEFQEAKTFFDKIQQVAKVTRAYYIYPEPSCYTRGSGRYSTKECHQGLVEKTCFFSEYGATQSFFDKTFKRTAVIGKPQIHRTSEKRT